MLTSSSSCSASSDGVSALYDRLRDERNTFAEKLCPELSIRLGNRDPLLEYTALRNRGEPQGFSRLVGPLMASAMRRANRKDLARIKQPRASMNRCCRDRFARSAEEKSVLRQCRSQEARKLRGVGGRSGARRAEFLGSWCSPSCSERQRLEGRQGGPGSRA
jgi:hypothetical protein